MLVSNLTLSVMRLGMKALLVSGLTPPFASLRGWEMLVFHKERVLCAS